MLRASMSRVLFAAAAVSLAIFATPSEASETRTEGAKGKAAPSGGVAWCGQGYEAVSSDVCHIDGRKPGAERKTLVIWLHGLIGVKTDWSHNHQKMLHRVAKYEGVEVLFPRGVEANGAYGWPGTVDAQEKSEQALYDGWMKAKAALEKRDNKAFDEVFVFGFSSGAYFTSSLAMRGRFAVDGYATFAGGQGSMIKKDTVAVDHFAPTFVGICAEDAQTAQHSRAFAGALAAAGIPWRASEQRVGHGLSEVHFKQALAFLRSKKTQRVG